MRHTIRIKSHEIACGHLSETSSMFISLEKNVSSKDFLLQSGAGEIVIRNDFPILLPRILEVQRFTDCLELS